MGTVENSCMRSRAPRKIRRESPRFEPRPTKAMASLRLGMSVRIRNPVPLSLQPQYILHVVKAGLLLHEPLGGAEGAVGESVAAGGFVREFHPFATVGEDDGVVAHDIAAADGVNADLGAGAFAHDALAAVAEGLLK